MTGKRFAILIAASKFPEEPGLTALRCPEQDVDALNEILGSPEFGQFTETFVFKNKPSHEVLEQIETVLHDAGREDLVLLYFSGHGKLNPAGQLCLATANTKLKKLGSTSIPVERIKSFFDAADTRQRILILDCCYSGAVGKDFVKGGVDDQLQLMSGGQGTFIMTASTGIQVAVEKEGDSLGLFTKHLVEGIRSGEADRDEDGLVDIHELYQHVHEKVRAEGAQEPMKWDINAKGRMIVATTGRDAKEKRRQELRTKLCGLAAQGYLSDSILGESLKLIAIPAKEMTAKDRQCCLLTERLADGRLSPADFVENWVKSCLVIDQNTSASTKNLWSWLLHDVFADVLLRIIFAIFLTGIFVLSLKQWQSRPDVKPIAYSTPEAEKAAPSVAAIESAVEPSLVAMPKMAIVSVHRLPVQSLSPSALSPLPTLPPPPKMGTISVSRQAVPSSLSQTKLPPLPEAEKMPQKGKTIGQYIDHGDGTITDTQTGLMWKRCAEGLSGVNCEDGQTEEHKWDDAVQRFKNVAYAGYSDWRLPTINELKTLVYCSKGRDEKQGYCNEGSEQPTINQQAFPDTVGWYWSGSPLAFYAGYSRCVNFCYGYSHVYARHYSFAVRLVRGGQ